MIKISIWSDHDCGALSDEGFERECIRMNNRDRIEREMAVSSLEEMCDLMCGAPEEDFEDDSEGGLIEDE